MLAANRSELGLNGSKAPEQTLTVDGRACLFGDLFAFDVDDATPSISTNRSTSRVTYAPDRTQPFSVAWDQNGGEGFGVSDAVTPEPGATLRRDDGAPDEGTARRDSASRRRTSRSAAAAASSSATSRSAGAGTTATPAGASDDSARGQGREERRSVPARLGLYDASGRTPLPSDDALLVHRYADETRLMWVAQRLLWPSAHRLAFYAKRHLRSGGARWHLRTGRHQRTRVPRASRARST